MAITFPQSPSTNDIHVVGNISYVWDGNKWAGGGITPIDRLIEDSNILEIENDDLLWTGSNVGVGSGSPSKKLEVAGGEVSFSTNTIGNHTHLFTTNAADDGRYFIKSGTTTKVDIQANGITYFNGGNVGVGDTNPTQKLSVNGFIQLLQTSVTPTSSVGLTYYTNGNLYVMGGTSGTIISDGLGNNTVQVSRSGYVRIETNDGTERLRVDASGRTSISSNMSTQAPNAQAVLNIRGDSSLQGSVRIESQKGIEVSHIHHGDNGNWYIRSASDSGMVIIQDTGGNTGVGTSNPAYKLEVNGSFAATTKSFVIDHPTKEGMKLRYASLEGPENGVYVRGKTTELVIELPDYWTGLVDEDTISVNLTPIGKSQTLWVKSIKDNKVYVGSKCSTVEYFYTIYGERKDVEKLEVEIGA